ncbi:biotin synthase [Lachnospiraceae bacterium C7]|nr:biotin synthase [Lachnospiraceae bacterium C7]
MKVNLLELANEIINGKLLQKDDNLDFLVTCDLSELKEAANRIRKAFCGDTVDLCTIINGKSGNCGENCKYCAQSSYNHTSCKNYNFINGDLILREARNNASEGVNRFAIVTSGKSLSGKEFEQALDIYSKINKETTLSLCASLGFLTKNQFKKLYDVGVRNYHDNIETSRRYFPHICTTHSFDEKIATIKLAQSVGFNVCSGGIIGMGETWQDRIDMALTLQNLKIKSIPINVLMAIPGTPLENQAPLSPDEILRTIAIFRLINPSADIRLAGGRKLLPNNGKEAFSCGISSTITGNMLTTSGSTIKSDRNMLKQLGRIVI